MRAYINDTWQAQKVTSACRELKKCTRESVTRTSRISCALRLTHSLSSFRFFRFFFADRAAPKVFEIRGRDPHGAGGAKARGGGKSGEAGAIPAESCSLWQLSDEGTRESSSSSQHFESLLETATKNRRSDC